MRRLRQVIFEYADHEVGALGGSSKRKLKTEERARLRADLNAVQKTNGRLVWIAAGMLILLFAVSVIIVLTNLKESDIVKVASAALGISAAGCIRWMLGIWREKTNTEMLLQLAVDLEGEALSTVIMILARGKRI